MRMFIAIELTAEVRNHLVEVRETIRPLLGNASPLLGNASLTRDENLHITLKFLGDVDQRQQEDLIESLGKLRSTAMEIRAEAIECFPPRGPLRIVAAGFGGAGIHAMKALHQSIEQRCQHLGFEREQRAYRPHVTIARARPVLPAPLRQEMVDAGSSSFPGPAMMVEEVTLVASRLLPTGSEYSVVQRFRMT